MQVKGTAYLARKTMLERDKGVERVEALIRRFIADHPGFPNPVLATSLLPIREFMELNNRFVDELYDGDTMSYWTFGRGSAEWALTEGPYRRIREQKSLDEFVGSAPLLYRNYFTEGGARAQRDPDGTVQLWIEGIPAEFHHVYFEYAIVGYFERGLEMVSGKPVRHTRVAGFSAGNDHVHYRYRLG